MANNSREVLFTREKETKHTVRFKEMPALEQPVVIGTLYVQKWWAGETRALTVVITKEG